VKARREVIPGAISSVSQTRVWHLLIGDLVVVIRCEPDQLSDISPVICYLQSIIGRFARAACYQEEQAPGTWKPEESGKASRFRIGEVLQLG